MSDEVTPQTPEEILRTALAAIEAIGGGESAEARALRQAVERTAHMAAAAAESARQRGKDPTGVIRWLAAAETHESAVAAHGHLHPEVLGLRDEMVEIWKTLSDAQMDEAKHVFLRNPEGEGEQSTE